jgi:predicted DsbA family dithiol-disulfide isomerase
MRSYTLTRSYQIRGVPMFVVNGTYVVGLDTLEGERSPEKLFATINRLAKQELDRQKRP